MSREEETGAGVLLLTIGYVGYIWIRELPYLSQLSVASFMLTCVFLLLNWSTFQRRHNLTRRKLLYLKPTEFEKRVQLLLQDLGWKNVRHRGGRGDRGVDLVAEGEDGSWIVQCKRYKGNVLPKEVRELIGTLTIQKADGAILVTTGRFTEQGWKEASGHRIDLWDGKTLAKKIQQIETAKRTPEEKKRFRVRFVLKYGIVATANALALLWLVG